MVKVQLGETVTSGLGVWLLGVWLLGMWLLGVWLLGVWLCGRAQA